MSQPAISTTAGAAVDEVLDVMRRRAVRRLNVIDEARQAVGIVTRTDLLHPFARRDLELRNQLCRGLPRLGVSPGEIRLDVAAGTASMAGTLADTELVGRVEEAVRDTPGILFVESRLRGRGSSYLHQES